jgi:D-alanyl-D-alanine carboxypeptidase
MRPPTDDPPTTIDLSAASAMRNYVILAIIASVALGGCGSTRTREGVRAEAARETALAANVGAVAAQLASDDAFSGVVLLSRNGRPLLRRGFGLADRAVGRTNTPETPFALASVGKMFTAVAIAKLVQQNRLSFDARLGSLLPAYPSAEAREQVTVHHLLTMSSGIPDVFRVPEFWTGLGTIKTLPDFWRYFARSPLRFRPGTQWAYSNSNFLLPGAIIEQVTGRPFTSVVEEQVIRPLGLTATRYTFDPTRRPALGYTRTAPAGIHADSARWYPAWEEPKPGGDFVVGSPMGGGYSTVDDLAQFADALMANRLLGPELTARVLTGYIDAEYGGRDGYGFETRLVNGVKMAGHRGALAGSSNQVEFYPDLGYVLVVLGNSDSDATGAIAQRARSLINSSPRGINPP